MTREEFMSLKPGDIILSRLGFFWLIYSKLKKMKISYKTNEYSVDCFGTLGKSFISIRYLDFYSVFLKS